MQKIKVIMRRSAYSDYMMFTHPLHGEHEILIYMTGSTKGVLNSIHSWFEAHFNIKSGNIFALADKILNDNYCYINGDYDILQEDNKNE